MTIKDQFQTVRRYGDIAQICRMTGLSRITVERWEAGNTVTAKTEARINEAITQIIKNREQ